MLVKVAEAGRIESFMTGQSFESVISRMFAGLPVLQGVLEKFTKPSDNGNGSANGNRLTGVPTVATK